MAKMFYTLDEAKTALGKSEDEIKQFAREGRLREFRDGPRLMFKADQVEQLKSDLGSGDNVDLGVSDSGGLIGLVDTSGASGTSITLSDEPGQGPGSAAPGALRTKEDTALATDLGLSGSMGGVPSPAPRSSGGHLSGTGLSGTASGSRAGINVFGDDSDNVDPSAQTAITGGIREQINLEGVGSGSGLLDLTRESDDTSLGAVLDGIGPAVTGARAPVETIDTSAMMEEETERVSRAPAAPVYVEAPDPLAAAFGGAALGGALVLLVALFVLLSAVADTHPDFIKQFDKGNWYMAIAYGFGIVAVCFVVGLVIGKTTSGRRA